MGVSGANGTLGKGADYYQKIDEMGGKVKEDFTKKMTQDLMAAHKQAGLKSFNAGKSLANNFKV